MTSKLLAARTTAIALGAGLLLSLYVPLFANAQVISQGSFCNSLTTVQTRIMERHTERATTHAGKRSDVENKFAEKKTERLGRLDANRNKTNTARTAQYARLESLAQTDAQKSAVAEFKKTLENAIATRRASIDDAIKTFEASTQRLWDAREADAKSFASDHKKDMDALFVTAQTSCRRGENPADVRDTLRIAMSKLNTTYRERAQAMTHTTEIKTARETLRTATQTAEEKFKASTKTARETLRASFGITE